MAVRLLFVLASGIVAASCGMRWLPSPRRGTLLGYVVGATAARRVSLPSNSLEGVEEGSDEKRRRVDVCGGSIL